MRSSLETPKPPMSPISISSQSLKSGLVNGLVAVIGLGAVIARVALWVLGFALVLDFEVVFFALLLPFMAGSLG